MPIINEYDAITGENLATEISAKELTDLLSDAKTSKPIDEIFAEKEALKAAALTKLAALGLTEDEAKAIIG